MYVLLPSCTDERGVGVKTSTSQFITHRTRIIRQSKSNAAAHMADPATATVSSHRDGTMSHRGGTQDSRSEAVCHTRQQKMSNSVRLANKQSLGHSEDIEPPMRAAGSVKRRENCSENVVDAEHRNGAVKLSMWDTQVADSWDTQVAASVNSLSLHSSDQAAAARSKYEAVNDRPMSAGIATQQLSSNNNSANVQNYQKGDKSWDVDRSEWKCMQGAGAERQWLLTQNKANDDRQEEHIVAHQSLVPDAVGQPNRCRGWLSSSRHGNLMLLAV